MSYAAYVTTTGVIDSLHRTEDDVDARLAEDSTLSKTGDETFPEGIRPETWLWNTTDSKFEEILESHSTDAEVGAALKERVQVLVLRFDEGLKAHWAGQKSVAGENPSDIWDDGTKAQRYNTTDLWARSWIGIAWREADRLETGDANKMSQENAEKIVAQAEAEIPSANHIRFWYGYHDADDWAGWMNPMGNGIRTYYKTNADGTGSVFTDPSISVSASDWTDIITTQYENAFKAAIA